ncbi:hypothetical protein SAY86_007874 [Trapa natans]|uniref:Cytochrome P450 n=1 Tax=Trapa natans TaxID=22666 RepID=A0AAN7R0M1_TRANT|nr:hypothetical protein SAY86_007874 [Trapa natans]
MGAVLLSESPRCAGEGKARDQCGQDCLIDEPDVAKLPYLQNIIFETLRLKPAAPLLVPHRASKECEIAGFHVLRDSMSKRFEVVGPGEESRAHKFIMPFEIGRRACPGALLAQRVVSLTLGSLILCFDGRRMSKEAVDMTEGKGVTMPKAVALELMCIARPIIQKVVQSNE